MRILCHPGQPGSGGGGRPLFKPLQFKFTAPQLTKLNSAKIGDAGKNTLLKGYGSKFTALPGEVEAARQLFQELEKNPDLKQESAAALAKLPAEEVNIDTKMLEDIIVPDGTDPERTVRLDLAPLAKTIAQSPSTIAAKEPAKGWTKGTKLIALEKRAETAEERYQTLRAAALNLKKKTVVLAEQYKALQEKSKGLEAQLAEAQSVSALPAEKVGELIKRIGDLTTQRFEILSEIPRLEQDIRAIEQEIGENEKGLGPVIAPYNEVKQAALDTYHDAVTGNPLTSKPLEALKAAGIVPENTDRDAVSDPALLKTYDKYMRYSRRAAEGYLATTAAAKAEHERTAEIRTAIEAMREDIEEIRGSIAQINAGAAAMKTDIEGAASDLTALKGQVGAVVAEGQALLVNISQVLLSNGPTT